MLFKIKDWEIKILSFFITKEQMVSAKTNFGYQRAAVSG